MAEAQVLYYPNTTYSRSIMQDDMARMVGDGWSVHAATAPTEEMPEWAVFYTRNRGYTITES